MGTLPPAWQKWAKRRLPLVAVVAAASVMLAMLALHLVEDIAVMTHARTEPVHAVAMRAPVRRAAAQHPVSAGPFVGRSILPIPGPIKFGQYYWDETKGEPGPLVITVDLAARVLSVFENGHEVGATAILKGYGDKPTPVGVFPITQKDATHVSNIFDVPMPWMLRLTNDGVSIHGSKVERGYATNGCIGVPDEFAQKLFHVAHLGDRVIITDGKQLKLGDPIISPPNPKVT